MAVARIISGASQWAHHQLRFWCHPAMPTTHFRLLSSTRIDPNAEWFEAQKIRLSVDLSVSATQLLKFLAEIDRNRGLYESPSLHRAIYRYKNCWLPLLAKQSELATSKRPLVVPLDCEWIWHVHRLNPKHYKTDCEELYGRVLDNANVKSTTQRNCDDQMKEIWNSMAGGEPFDLDLSSRLIGIDSVNYNNHSQRSSNYDLVSAVKRQCAFFYQVSRPFMNNALFLKEAIGRYKGFLHLIRRNKEESLRSFCVPTYDIDLIWHAHQLHPAFYFMDTTDLYGELLDHDDTVSDRSKDTKLNVGFMDTTKQWEKLYGLRYWKAGAMFRGNAPSPLAIDDAVPFKEAYTSDINAKDSQNIIQLPKKMQTEVLLEIVDLLGIPQGQKDKLFIVIRQKNQNDRQNPTKKLLAISSNSMKTMKQVIIFQSEPTTELLVELVSNTSTINDRNLNKIIGSTTISFADVVDVAQELLVDRWFELLTPLETKETKLSLRLRISMSFTPFASAAYILHMVISQGYLNHTSVLDDNGNSLIEIYLRERNCWHLQIIERFNTSEKCWQRMVFDGFTMGTSSM